jgi:WxL domain surface cell wall-binding
MRHRLLLLLAVATTALLAAAAAVAGTLTPTAHVSGTAGVSLGLPADPSFNDTLDGSDQAVTYAPVLGVVDARGSGAGWNLTVASTPFDDGSGHTLAAGSVTSVGQSCDSGSSCTAASPSGVTYPVSLAATAAKVFNAAANTGMGKVDVTPTVSVSIPGNAYAGTYTATVTLAAATGP